MKDSQVTYNQPTITFLGSVVALTKGGTSPVSDNGHNGNDGYYDAANDPTGPGGPRTATLLNVDNLD